MYGPFLEVVMEKVHAIVARSTFASQKCKKMMGSDHFWKLRCQKSARRWGAKHVSKSKCTRHTSSGPLLDVEMSKECTPLWHQAHFQVKIYKTPCSAHFWKLRCRKSARPCGAKHVSKSKCTEHRMLTVQMWFCVAGARDCEPYQKWAKREGFVAIPITTANTLHYTPLHSTPLHSTPPHHTTPHHTTPHHTTPHHTTPHHTTPHPPTNHLTHLSHIPTKLTHFLTLSSIFYLVLNDNEITIKSLLLNTVSYLERYIGENRAAQSYFCQPFLSLLLLFVSTSLSGQLKLVHTQKARALCAVGKCCSFRWFTTFYCDKQVNVTKGKGWVVFNALTSKGGWKEARGGFPLLSLLSYFHLKKTTDATVI